MDFDCIYDVRNCGFLQIEDQLLLLLLLLNACCLENT
jgi:hypothetical protein